MPALATTHSLSSYRKLSISRYREQLKQGSAQSIEVNYNHRGKSYSYPIQLTQTACHYGNYRYWWLCPNCSKRVSVLYCAGRYVCRHCINACYQSQLQQPIDRLFSRVDAIRARLDWQAGIINGIGAKPRYMHLKTFERLVNEHDKLVKQIVGEYQNALA